MRIPACIFTYAGDAMALPWCVRGALAAGFIPVVLEDAAAPLPGHTRGWLEERGVELRATTFPRRGNLNGTDCAAGICRELALAAMRHGSPSAIKQDTDSVVVRAELFTAHQRARAVGLIWQEGPRRGAFGMAYQMRLDVAVETALFLEGLPLDVTAPEDLTIWAAAGRCGERIEHEFQEDGGPFTALPEGADVADAVERFGVITTGNRPANGWTDKPRQVATEMRRLVLEIEGRKRGCNAGSGALQQVG